MKNTQIPVETLSENDCSPFENAVKDVVQQNKPGGKFTLDLSALETISASGVSSLLRLRRLLENSGSSLRLCGLSHEVQTALEVMRFFEPLSVLTKLTENKKPLKLTAMQRWLLDTQLLDAKSTMLNIGNFFLLDHNFDFDRLCVSIDQTYRENDAYHIRFVYDPETLEVVQIFSDEREHIVPLKMSEEEFASYKETCVRPFTLIGERLYVVGIIQTPKENYWFSNLHHTIVDGFTLGVLLFKSITAHYEGKKVTPYSFEAYLRAQEDAQTESAMTDSRRYWEEKIALFNPAHHALPRFVASSEPSVHRTEIFEKDVPLATETLVKSHFGDVEAFFLLAALIAQAKVTGQKDAWSLLVQSGRTVKNIRIHGVFIEEPVCHLDMSESLPIEKAIQLLVFQRKEAAAHFAGLSALYEKDLDAFLPTFHYDLGFMVDQTIAGLPLFVEEHPHPLATTPETPFDVQLLCDEGAFFLHCEYDAAVYAHETVKTFCDALCKAVTRMVSHTGAEPLTTDMLLGEN